MNIREMEHAIHYFVTGDGVIVSNNSRLFLPDLNVGQSGTYTCIARNIHGHVWQDHVVQVHQIPYFTSRPHSKAYPMAITIRLECQASGTPTPKLLWLKDGKPLALDGVSKKQQSSGFLVFRHTFSKDSGM